jgi:hypothetical protein
LPSANSPPVSGSVRSAWDGTQSDGLSFMKFVGCKGSESGGKMKWNFADEKCNTGRNMWMAHAKIDSISISAQFD